MFRGIYFFLIILTIPIIQSCVPNDLPELSYNLLDDESVPLFTLDSVEFFLYSTIESDVRVNFSSVYDQLSDSQKENIAIIVVDKPTSTIKFEPDRNFFEDGQKRKGTNVCYDMHFETTIGELTKPVTFCFDVE